MKNADLLRNGVVCGCVNQIKKVAFRRVWPEPLIYLQVVLWIYEIKTYQKKT